MFMDCIRYFEATRHFTNFATKPLCYASIKLVEFTANYKDAGGLD
ncbi:hypothetical protein PAECIP112173_01871 [Paenibacillus sp. JJ-100]|nr:hypothetical protein PAECIP112173_01871 [Paenibacillus sp. JJ-100]